MDYRTIHSRQLKWKAFLASVLVCAVSVCGMIGTALAKNHASSEIYRGYLEEARELLVAGSDIEAFDKLKQAVKVDPGNYEAYDLLMDDIEEDGRMDEVQELPQIKNLMNVNLEALKDSSPEGYADLHFRIGRMLFMLTGSRDNHLKSAANYFEKALENGYMESSSDEKVRGNARLAQSMATIGNYIGQLDRGGSSSAVLDDEVTYRTLWDDLNRLYQENPLDTVTNVAIGVSLYSRISILLYENYEGFESAGITVNEIMAFVDQLHQAVTDKEAAMGDTAKSEKYREFFDIAYGNMETTRQVLLGASKKGDG